MWHAVLAVCPSRIHYFFQKYHMAVSIFCKAIKDSLQGYESLEVQIVVCLFVFS